MIKARTFLVDRNSRVIDHYASVINAAHVVC